MSAVDGLETVYVQVEDLLLQSEHMEAEGMGCDDESALGPDDVDGLLHGKSLGDLLRQEQSYDLTIGGGHLLSDDDLDVLVAFGVLLADERSLGLVVVGDAEHIHPVLAGLLHLLLRGGHGLGELHDPEVRESGVFGMDVGVGFSHGPHHR